MQFSGGDLRADSLTESHADWAEDVRTRHPELNADNAEEIINAEVGAIFEQALLDAGVFKRDDKGAAAFARFIAELKNS